MKISKRKLESYRRAEVVCRELRAQIASPAQSEVDMNKLCNLIIKWMRVTGEVKYKRPDRKG